MSKPAKTQWDFGELFSPAQTRQVLTVSELTARVRRLLEKQVGQVWVTGEISNLRRQASGHCYFTLKDAGSQLACVLFRGEAADQRELLEDGRKALLYGDLTVYEARGQYQLIVRAVEWQGEGALQLAFERLKRKLQAEGLFAPERKRPLPAYVHRLGLITSPTGAALRDVLTILRRRDPGLEIILAPCRVQGEGAAAEIAAALNDLNAFNLRQPPDHRLDLALLTRGGGSLEDLWAFNEEIVARAIFDSALPVVSAVGHEIDFTIADFVADLRAPTPSAAAEIISEGVFSAGPLVTAMAGRLRQQVRRRLARCGEDLGSLGQRLARCQPRRRLNERRQRLDDLAETLHQSAQRGLGEHRRNWLDLARRLLRVRPAQNLARRRETLRALASSLAERAQRRLEAVQNRQASLTERLRLLSPDLTLARGYSITMDAASGEIIRDAARVRRGQPLKTRVSRGEIHSVAGEIPTAGST